MFTDDYILFGDATVEEAIILKNILKKYEEASRQCINFKKSTTFFSNNTSNYEKQQVSQMLNVRISTEFEKYLGLSNVVSRGKRKAFQGLKERLKVKITG